MKKFNFLIAIFAFLFMACNSPEKNKKTEKISTKDSCKVSQTKSTVIDISDSYTLLKNDKIPNFKDGLPKKSAIAAAKSSLQYYDSLKVWNAENKLVYKLKKRRSTDWTLYVLHVLW